MDWAATCLFYAAVHYVNAFLVKRGKPLPRKHHGESSSPGRTDIVRDDPELQAIYPEYRDLEDVSRNARYLLSKISVKEYDKLVKELTAIREHVILKIAN